MDKPIIKWSPDFTTDTEDAVNSSFHNVLAKMTRPDLLDTVSAQMQNKPSILIVDDEDIITHTLAAFFSHDYTVYQAADGHEAMQLIGANKGIELILSDINMPVVNGYELLEKVRADYSNMVVILMTALTSDELLTDVKKKGAYDCLSKPFDLDKLKNTIKNALERK